jgi:hypothetical protein
LLCFVGRTWMFKDASAPGPILTYRNPTKKLS